MAARTLEKRRDVELEHARIQLMMMEQHPTDPVWGASAGRLEHIAACVTEAADLQKKIEKRDAKKVSA